MEMRTRSTLLTSGGGLRPPSREEIRKQTKEANQPENIKKRIAALRNELVKVSRAKIPKATADTMRKQINRQVAELQKQLDLELKKAAQKKTDAAGSAKTDGNEKDKDKNGKDGKEKSETRYTPSPPQNQNSGMYNPQGKIKRS
jgi:hypothetical protein